MPGLPLDAVEQGQAMLDDASANRAMTGFVWDNEQIPSQRLSAKKAIEVGDVAGKQSRSANFVTLPMLLRIVERSGGENGPLVSPSGCQD